MNPTRHSRRIRTSGLVSGFALALIYTAILVTTQPAQAQTFSVIHNFTGGSDGWAPIGTTVNGGGTIYGSEQGGCCGVVFKMQRFGTAWILSPIYTFFVADPDGAGPGPITIAPDSSLYAATTAGGITGGQCGQAGCGTVINLRVPPNASVNALRPWNISLSYAFAIANDGAMPGPLMSLTFDSAGNMYGTTQFGGVGNGTVFKLVQGDGGLHESVIYNFAARPDGNVPEGGLAVDAAGNLYGTTSLGGTANFGTVFELSPNGSGYTEKVLYNFQNGSDGSQPWGELVLDAAGNLYGTATSGGSGNGGTVFELTPSGGNWTFNLLHSFPGTGGFGPIAGLTMDSAGNLYGTSVGGPSGQGFVYKLTRSGEGWTFTDLHDFTGTDGSDPEGVVTLGPNGTLYGTAKTGGAFNNGQCDAGCGVIWQITP